MATTAGRLPVMATWRAGMVFTAASVPAYRNSAARFSLHPLVRDPSLRREMESGHPWLLQNPWPTPSPTASST